MNLPPDIVQLILTEQRYALLSEEWSVIMPSSWPALTRANAVCQLQNLGKFQLNTLAALSLLATEGDEVIAAKLLVAGWCPGEAYLA